MRITLRGTGKNENIEGQVDRSTQALRVSLRPLEWADQDNLMGGHYFFEVASGALTAVSAAGPLLSVRNTSDKYALILKRLSMWYYITTAYTTAQMNDFDLIRATGWSVADSGGAAFTPLKKRNSTMGPSKADCRVCTTGALTAGTRTLDAIGIRAVVDGPPNVAIPTATLAVNRQELVLFDHKEIAVHPAVFDYQEGFIVRPITTMGAVGVIKAYFQGEFAEVPNY
jgi:hypothetical protein